MSTRLHILLLACALAGAVDETFIATARGFGRVEVAATWSGPPGARSSATRFRCADAGRAMLCASKRLADLTGFGGIAAVDAGGLPGSMLACDGAGLWLLAVQGVDVHELFAPDREGLRRLATALPAGCRAVVPRSHPRWLDCFDESGLGVWVGGGGEDYDLPDDFAWLQRNRMAMCTLYPGESRLVAPGVVDSSISEWHAAMAGRHDLAYRSLLFPSRPAWLWNQAPLPHVRAEAGRVTNPFLEYQATSIAESYEPVPATDRLMDDLRRRMAQRQAADPRFIGWHGCTETPNAGILELAAVAGMAETKTQWHRYLREVCGYGLADLAARHYAGRPAPRAWAAVEVPLPRDFLGWDPASGFDLRGTWEMRADPRRLGREATGEWTAGDCNDVLIGMYGTRYNHGKDRASFWMRRTLEIPAARLEAQRYLHIARSEHHGNYQPAFAVWVNGRPLPRLTRDERGDWDQCFDLAGALRPGANLIEMDTCGSPVPGHIFTSGEPYRTYPQLGDLTQRWYDAVGFSAWLRMQAVEGRLRSLRAGDPDRPLKLMSLVNLLDLAQPLCDRYGAYNHDTGGAAGYWSPMTGGRLARSHGQAWSSEQGGPPGDVAAMRKAATLYVMYGNDALDMVFGVSAYSRGPAAAWVEANLDLLRCIGRMQLPLPPVAILRSARNTRLGFDQPWNWDLGRGSLQAVGRNFAYVETPDLADGTVDRATVLFDAGTVLMTEADVDGLERFVRQGGVFVAQHHSGRHAPGRADAWPIARLTGLTARASGPALGRSLRFADGQTLWPTLRGRTIDGHGAIRDFRERDITGDPVGFEATGDGVQVVASWTGVAAGGGQIAVAVRRLGTGMVVTLGSTFWRDALDAGGAYREGATAQNVLDELLTSVGVPRDSWTGQPDMWAELWRSKNGVFDLYPVARMDERGGEGDARQAEVSLRRDQAPSRLVEISAAGHPVVAATWADGRLRLPAAGYLPMQSRVFAAPRADRERAGLDWFRTQAGIWHALPGLPPASATPVVAVPDTVMPLADGWQLDADGVRREVRLGAFATMGLPEDAHARFTRSIAIPPAWQGRRITLAFDAERYGWGLLPQGRLWIDGVPAALPQPIRPAERQGFALDVAAAAADGSLELVLEIDASAVPPAGRKRKPAGVTGIFLLSAEPQPLRSEALSGPWEAALDYGVLRPVEAGGTARYVYLQTSFETPVRAPAPRLFLAADGALGCIVLNGNLVSCPPEMTRLDITGLVVPGRNLLRWAPDVPYSERVRDGAPPALRLEWQDADPR